jgi:outer membrane cobalamin receptor
MLSLSNGQSDNIFQPARLFASASVLNIQTLIPKFPRNKIVNGKVSMKVGSFGLLNPSFWLEGKVSSILSASLSAEWLSADGKYPYILEYSSNSNGIYSSEIRQNTDVQNLRLEGTVHANFSEKENGYIKTYFYQSERGLPGATIFYNSENSSKQRIWDNAFFTQAHYEKEFSTVWSFQSNAKFNQGYVRYLDPTYLNAEEKLENTYLQKEFYGSTSVLCRLQENITLSASTDGIVNSLEANVHDFFQPKRYTWLTDVAAKYVTNQILATASLLSSLSTEIVKTADADENQRQLSPYISLSFKPFNDKEFRMRIFYKNIFRLPSFNDLYYSQVGNRNLKPEKTNQYNIGLTYCTSFGKWLPLLSFTLDGYHNDVTDKIIAYPNKSTFFWTILNLGKVSIDGLDLTAETTFLPWRKIGIVFGSSYTYQRALNITNPTDGSYNQQLPYTPRVSGSGKAALETPWINLSYAVLWSGHRYAVNQNYVENRLPSYADQSISVSRSFNTKHYLIFANVEILNLLDQNYAIVRYFPMPGRSYRATVSVKF